MIYFELFYTFFLIGLFTFGGGYAMIPMIQEQVTSKGWITVDELKNFIAISEMTPGPFAINISTFVGSKTAGIFGAFCSTLGVVLPSFIVIVIVAFIITKFIKNRWVKGALFGVRPIVLALILSTAFTFFLKAIVNVSSNEFNFNRQSFSLLLILFGIFYTYKIKEKKNLNPLWILLLSGVLGLIIF